MTPTLDATALELDAQWRARLRAPDPAERRAVIEEILSASLAAMIDAAHYILSDLEAAKDVAQEVAIRFWRRHAHVNVHNVQVTLIAYLIACTRNHARDARQRTATRQRWHAAAPPAPQAVESDAMEQLATADFVHCIEQAIQRMPPRRREVVELSIVHELRHDDVAVILGIARWSVINHLNHAARDVAAALSKAGLRHFPKRRNIGNRWITWLAHARRADSSSPPSLPSEAHSDA